MRVHRVCRRSSRPRRGQVDQTSAGVEPAAPGEPLGPVAALRRIGFLLERRLADTYKVKAFRGAVNTLLRLSPEELDRRCAEGTLQELEGIGKATAAVV